MSLQTNSFLHHSALQVASDLDEMAIVVEWFDQFNSKHLPYQMWIEGQTALLEGFTNVVRHAHSHLSSQTPVDLAATIDSKSFQIYIWDCGDIFDLEAVLEELNQQTSNGSFNPLDREAHWGCIFLLRLKRDYGWTVSYTREAGDKNCLLLKKDITR
ncbi:anti-sigma regulatory factor [Calothrix sp. FACHB-1219]|uniref:ATP-binding protein n=1 Tax=unclassified Calothrix TaxID=2619626 RepID=UPI0016868A6C|nr:MULTISPECIES: anti-sigma regulatory factor [unclassified Calothrix]MBD2204663.1 anti-sigma regulatory factor [Calothrix sp. FACHB-168]MBD2216825.1 anti-sigma regulatory factor [Calothrix sp. FACHB-1219]